MIVDATGGRCEGNGRGYEGTEGDASGGDGLARSRRAVRPDPASSGVDSLASPC
jgi:hypothetical protein